jgi:hypothetical protein
MVAETPEAAPAAGAIVAVGQARSAGSKLPAADLEGVKQLLTQTKAIGIILPPPDIRAIIDKTAQFVAKNGEQCCELLLLLLLQLGTLAATNAIMIKSYTLASQMFQA